jgi:uncharacterized protein (TIGR03663 family)
MHGDEAVNAYKLGQLLETGTYRYDPNEFHGPSLYYFSLIPAFIGSVNSFSGLTEPLLRIVPVIFSLLLILLFLFLKPYIESRTLCLSVLLLSLSPAMVFYSRYFIHEMIFVFFTYAFIFTLYKFLKKSSTKTAVINGLSLGGMIITKETWIVPVFAATIAAIPLALLQHARIKLNRNHLFYWAGAVITLYILFYSSFFSNSHGLIDGVKTYGNYFSRGTEASVHVKPWSYYLSLLWLFDGRWSEAGILMFALIGVFGAFFKRDNSFYLFMALFTVVTTIVISLIPYKTPWNLLLFWPGAILLASVGMGYMYDLLTGKLFKVSFILMVTLIVLHLSWQAYELNYKFDSSTSNPYVYAHPTRDVFEIQKKMTALAGISPKGFDMLIQIIIPHRDYWPLPWYLRKFTHIGYWEGMPDSKKAADVYVTNPALEGELGDYLYTAIPFEERSLYLPLFEKPVYLRPAVELRLFVKKSLWELAE